MKNVYKFLVGKLEAGRPLERYRYRWKDNIKQALNKCVRVWTGFIWLRITIDGWL
jgi:hypothetical protein